ncbi:hypothetical protein [Leucobacter sp. UCD-THU]|uniref:hypothetical protein n=1 Tax=Leucobacter sp. UCD-THU TaxID=1292023 RepID=UPI001267BB0F|nr:hypothetical protein [Leucobacter sp. UCD-THU]
MTAHLPRGSAVWEYYGGQRAITAETESLWLVEHATIAVASAKPDRVKPRPYPLGVREQERQQQYTTSQADAWRRKQQARLDAASADG